MYRGLIIFCRPVLFVFSFALCILMLPQPGFSAETASTQKRLFAEDEVLLRFREGVSDDAKANAHARVGGKRVKKFKIVQGLELVKIPKTISVEEAIQLYQQSTDVKYAEPNYIARAQTVPNDTYFSSLWGLKKINAPGAWDLGVGSSSAIILAIDTGIDYNHPDLAYNVWSNPSDCNSNGIDDDGDGYVDDCHGIDTANGDSDPMDDYNHGTHVAGIIGAVGNNGMGIAGVNWNVSIIGCKFIAASGHGYLSDAVSCLEYAKILKDRGENIVATNNSWLIADFSGTEPGPFSKAVFDAVEEHRKSGILFIASAGNFGLDSDINPTYPASNYLANVISVAATDSVDGLASFSNRGRRSVHVGAPGVGRGGGLLLAN